MTKNNITKEEKQKLLFQSKQETLKKDKAIIDKFRPFFDENKDKNCDLMSDNIYIKFCESYEDKKIWLTFVHLTSSLPFRGAVGRQIKILIYCKDIIIGMAHLTSPLAQCKVRDDYLKFKDKWRELKNIYNIETCVPTEEYRHLLTGKLIVYSLFSQNIKEYIKNKYGTNPIGFETTSLYGKSSMYNRIPFFKYLGETEGLSGAYVENDEWRKILNEYYKVYPKTKTNRIAPVKFQIIDKLNNYYKKKGLDFPYEYKNVAFKRGVYFGYLNQKITLDERVQEWRERWLSNRIKRVENDNDKR